MAETDCVFEGAMKDNDNTEEDLEEIFLTPCSVASPNITKISSVRRSGCHATPKKELVPGTNEWVAKYGVPCPLTCVAIHDDDQPTIPTPRVLELSESSESDPSTAVSFEDLPEDSGVDHGNIIEEAVDSDCPGIASTNFLNGGSNISGRFQPLYFGAAYWECLWSLETGEEPTLEDAKADLDNKELSELQGSEQGKAGGEPALEAGKAIVEKNQGADQEKHDGMPTPKDDEAVVEKKGIPASGVWSGFHSKESMQELCCKGAIFAAMGSLAVTMASWEDHFALKHRAAILFCLFFLYLSSGVLARVELPVECSGRKHFGACSLCSGLSHREVSLFFALLVASIALQKSSGLRATLFFLSFIALGYMMEIAIDIIVVLMEACRRTKETSEYMSLSNYSSKMKQLVASFLRWTRDAALRSFHRNHNIVLFLGGALTVPGLACLPAFPGIPLAAILMHCAIEYKYGNVDRAAPERLNQSTSLDRRFVSSMSFSPGETTATPNPSGSSFCSLSPGGMGFSFGPALPTPTGSYFGTTGFGFGGPARPAPTGFSFGPARPFAPPTSTGSTGFSFGASRPAPTFGSTPAPRQAPARFSFASRGRSFSFGEESASAFGASVPAPVFGSTTAPTQSEATLGFGARSSRGFSFRAEEQAPAFESTPASLQASARLSFGAARSRSFSFGSGPAPTFGEGPAQAFGCTRTPLQFQEASAFGARGFSFGSAEPDPTFDSTPPSRREAAAFTFGGGVGI